MRCPGITLALLLSLAPSVPAQDLGRLLEGAARKVARDTLDDVVGRPSTPRPVPVPPGATQAPARQPAAPAPSLAPAGARGEEVAVKTRDGWTLVAHRFRPRVAPRPGAAPVILCHGLSYNASFWNLDPSCSLVEYLTGAGYDVWVADLRGSGASTKWVAKLAEAPEMAIGEAVRRISGNRLTPTGYATIDPKFSNWTLDHHIAYDVPAFVRLVRRETGAPDVTWIGHSMGGIVALGHLARHGNPGIGRLVTVGSQVTMPNGQLALQFLREMIETRTQLLAGRIDPDRLAAETRTSVHNMFFNQQNVLPQVYDALGTWATDVPALGVMQQYMTLGLGGELLDAQKQFNYARALANVQVPILIACGADDQFAPPAVQRYLFDNVGSPDKTLLIFGRQMGFQADSGHDDALVGLNSRAQVYPTIEAWIRGARPRK
jgi:pimeloyl-ACP methyl ester carboxylesterase